LIWRFARILQKPRWRPRPFEAEAVDVVWGVAVDERRRRNEATAGLEDEDGSFRAKLSETFSFKI